MTHLVFVYGSLLEGLANHRLLREYRARFVGKATSSARFTMLDLGNYPGCIESGAESIEGEVYEVDDAGFAALDRLEGYPRFYTRKRIRTSAGGRAWIYLLAGEPWKNHRVSGGSWRAHLATRGAHASRWA